MSGTTIEFYFDYASPWSYIADLRIQREFADLPVTIERIPAYLRGFEQFRDAVPYSSAKMAYLAKDMIRCASFYEAPLAPPPVFPINGLYLLRAHIALINRPECDAFREAAFRATWVDGANVSDPEVVVDVAARVGVERTELATAMASSETKATLRSNTDGAIERGVFGVPTMFVGDEMFWGQDRLDFLHHHVEALACAVTSMSDPSDE